MRGMECLGFESCAADAWVLRLIGNGVVATVVVVHVDDIYEVFPIGSKNTCDRFGYNLNNYVPISNLEELHWYAGCRFTRVRVSGTVTISQQT